MFDYEDNFDAIHSPHKRESKFSDNYPCALNGAFDDTITFVKFVEEIKSKNNFEFSSSIFERKT